MNVFRKQLKISITGKPITVHVGDEFMVCECMCCDGNNIQDLPGLELTDFRLIELPLIDADINETTLICVPCLLQIAIEASATMIPESAAYVQELLREETVHEAPA